MTSGHLRIPLQGRIVEVPRAALAAELARAGPIASLALVEAIVLAAPRADAITRLLSGVRSAPPSTVTLTSLLGLVRLDARETAAELIALAPSLAPPLAAATTAAARLFRDELDALCTAIAGDELLAQRVPLVLAAWPRAHEAHVVFVALLEALDRLQPGLGVTAYRSLLGDLGEAVFRALARGADADALLGEGRALLVDRLSAELPGTPDLAAARGMAWLLGTLAPADDAARSAIERARSRFRDPAFHEDCDVMLGERPGTWPPRT